MSNELDQRPARALKEAAFTELLESDRLDDLLPDEDHPEYGGETIVQKPTSIADEDLAAACLRVRLISGQSTPRGTVDQRTHQLQVQIDWTRDWHRARGPDWEHDLRDAVHDAIGRLGGKAFAALGGSGAVDAEWSEDRARYVGDVTFRYRTADVRETTD